jgi:hypothetical protein
MVKADALLCRKRPPWLGRALPESAIVTRSVQVSLARGSPGRVAGAIYCKYTNDCLETAARIGAAAAMHAMDAAGCQTQQQANQAAA